MRGVFHLLLDGALSGVASPRLLDVGCGTGVAMEEFARFGSISGLDLAHEALRYVKMRDPAFAVVQGDLARLPIASGSLDAILAFDVIEHLADDAAAIQEMRRALRPGGVVLLNVPAFSSLWSEKDTANHHLRRYTRSSLKSVVGRAGLMVERLTYTNATLFPAIWCFRRLQRLARRPWNSKAEYHPHAGVNSLLLGVLRMERGLLRLVDLPFGTSVTCLARRSG